MIFKLKFRRLCAWIIGLVFVWSGISKLADPVGTSYIMKEYFHFLHISFLDGGAKLLGTLFSLFETVLGILLTTGILRRITAWTTSILLGFFLALTFALLLVNPQMDCGCFGESSHLSHFDTFFKNIILLALAAGAWAGIKDFGTPKIKKYFSAIISMALVIVFTVLSWVNIPLRDYTDYAAGNKLLSADPYATIHKTRTLTVFYYEKDGERLELDRPVRPDSSWRFAGMSRRVQTWENPAADLLLKDGDGMPVDGLLDDGPVMVVSLYDKPGRKKWEKLCQWAEDAQAAGFQCIIASDERYYNDYPVYLADKKTLSTFNRSNGGITYLHDGEIIAKWSYLLRPGKKDLDELTEKDYIEIFNEVNGARERHFEAFILVLFAVLLLI